MTVFWDIVPCSVVEADRRFRGAYCLNHHTQRLKGNSFMEGNFIIIIIIIVNMVKV
jgi:hypothetical protein